MKNTFGVFSSVPANKRLKNGYTMYDWIVRKRCFPSFWGCVLLGEETVTTEEIEFLRQKHCKITFVIRDLTEVLVSKSNGRSDAQRAVEAAKKLGIPKDEGIAIWAYIEPDWSINHNWMISFAQVIASNGYVPGFVGNTDSSKNFNFDRQCSHFVQATREVDCFGAVYCATEPKIPNPPDIWEPYCPSAMEPEDMHLWAINKIYFGSFEADDVQARDEKILDLMW